MWIEKTRNGLRLVDRVKIDGKTRRISVPLDKDTPQARRRAADALRAKAEAVAVPVSVLRLSDAIEDYKQLKDCRASTLRTAAVNLRHAQDILGDVPLASLTPAYIRRRFYQSDEAPTVVNRSLSAFKTFCGWCVDMEYMTDNPARNIRPLKIDAPETDPAELYLEPERLQALLDQLHGMAYYATRFLALTGCRIGEAAALTPDDIGEKYITINKSLCSATGEVTMPKNRSSVRDVFIQPELRELLDDFLKWRNLDMMATGLRPSTLFYSRGGEVYREQYLDRVLFPLGAHPHLLRHTHVAILAAAGVSLDAIARRIGHKGTGTTKAVYYHVTERQREKDEAALAAVRIL